MNLAAIRVVLRPRTHGELLDLAALWCFTVDRRLYARLAGLVLLPSLGLCAAARWLVGIEWGEVWLLAIVLGTITQGVFTIATSRALFSTEVPLGAVLRTFAARLPAYVGALLLTRVVLALSALTIVLLPAAWARVAFVHEACLLEGGSAITATRRAWALGQQRGREISVLLAGLGLTLLAAILAAEFLGHGIVEFVLQLGRPVGDLFHEEGSLYALLGLHAAIPYIAVARFLGYVDERTRGDGWDIQLRFMALASDSGRAP